VDADRLLSKALARLSAPGALGPKRLLGVWVFGSQARGLGTPASDLDLGVLSEPPLELERFRLMDALGRELDRDVDVIDLRATSPILAWEVLTTGRCVLEADALAVEDFLRRARFAAEDMEQRDRMILLAQVSEPARP
jgi:predicted nucleotidyltransferase